MHSAMKTPVDDQGRPICEGDPVVGTNWGCPGERGLVIRAVGGSLISVRLESSGATVSSVAHLWRKIVLR